VATQVAKRARLECESAEYFKQELERVLIENDRLRKKLEDVESANDQLQDSLGRILEERVWPLEEENESLKNKLEEELERALIENDGLKKKLAEVETANDQLQDSLGRILEERVWPLEEENDKLADELEVEKARFEDEIQKILTQNLDAIDSDNEVVMEMDARTQAHLRCIEMMQLEFEERLASLLVERVQLQAQNDVLQKELEGSDSKIAVEKEMLERELSRIKSLLQPQVSYR
jgi:chromosome segregation ATPase